MLLIGEGRSTRRKICPNATLFTADPTRTALRPRPDISDDKTGSGRPNRGYFLSIINVTKRSMPNCEMLSEIHKQKGVINSKGKHAYIQTITTIIAQNIDMKKVNQSHYRPEVSRGFKEVKVPRLRDNGPGWW